MSSLERKSQEALRGMLQQGERVLRTCTVLVGIREGMIALTNRRIVVFGMGLTVMPAPRVAEVRLENVTNASYVPGGFMDGSNRHLLTIESRTGTHTAGFSKGDGRRQGHEWPHLILDAQKALQAASAGPPASDGRGGGDLPGQLRRLADLHRDGTLSDEEFAAAKSRLLGA